MKSGEIQKTAEEAPRGRGTGSNPGNRFEELHLELKPAENEEEAPSTPTRFYKDRSRSILAYNESPDVGFNASLNPYRGCEHGCIYCYARPSHEYLGFSSGLDFESRILVKENAPELLRKELSSPRWEPQVIALSGNTDCYQPVERRLKITRRCLEVLAEFRNPVSVITKNFLVTRDADLLKELSLHKAAQVFVSITTLDDGLRRRMEPRTSPPRKRLEAIERLSAHGIPTGVLIAPVIGALNDHEIPRILKAAKEVGARFAGYVVLRLPFAVKDLFEEWLQTHFPDRKEKVLGRIRGLRGGHLNDPRFGSRMKGEGIFAEEIRDLFRVSFRKLKFDPQGPQLSTEGFQRPGGSQIALFDKGTS